MAQHNAPAVSDQLYSRCPSWCSTDHDACTGQDNWVHVSAPLYVTPDVFARICLSIDPESGALDGPHVLIGDSEYTPEAAREIAADLIKLSRLRP